VFTAKRLRDRTELDSIVGTLTSTKRGSGKSSNTKPKRKTGLSTRLSYHLPKGLRQRRFRTMTKPSSASRKWPKSRVLSEVLFFSLLMFYKIGLILTYEMNMLAGDAGVGLVLRCWMIEVAKLLDGLVRGLVWGRARYDT
jgi:hypothetical protein